MTFFFSKYEGIFSQLLELLLSKFAETENQNSGGDDTFRNCPDRIWVLPSLQYSGYGVIPVSKAADSWRPAPTLSRVDFKERVELNLQSFFGPSWNVI